MDILQTRFLELIDRIPAFDERAVLFAFIAGLVTGWIWYAVVGHVWKASVNNGASLYSPRRYIFSAIAQIIMTIMLAILMKRLGEATMLGGLQTAVMIWFGFVMTTVLVNYANIGQRMSLTVVDALHWLIVLAVMGAVIGLVSTADTAAANARNGSAVASAAAAAGDTAGQSTATPPADGASAAQ